MEDASGPMINDTLHIVKSWLQTYAECFPAADDHSENLMHLKWIHSLHVAEHCRGIAEELGWSAHDVVVAETLGLLHDAGRFSQFAEYGTFSDPLSVDHGVRGGEVVRASRVLAPFFDSDRARILDGILFHNRRSIPPEISPDSLPFTMLVRDADKLDIYRIIIERVQNGHFREHLRVALGIYDEGPATQGAVDEILADRTVSNPHILTMADFCLMQISWVFDINYAPTLRRIRERGYIGEIAGFLPDEPGARKAVEYVLDRMETVTAVCESRINRREN